MSELTSIRIQGLRSIIDSGNVELRPINILVGTNSSGKSTFLRTFPLFRQSIEKRTRGPILWNGDYADFESYDNSVNTELKKDKENNQICFSFGFSLDFSDKFGPYTESKIPITASIAVKSSKKKFTSFTQNYSVTIDNHEIQMTFNEDGALLKVRSPRMSWELNKNDLKYQQAETDSLLPYLNVNKINSFWSKPDSSKDVSAALYNQMINMVRSYSGSKSSDRTKGLVNQILRIRGGQRKRLSILKTLSSTKKWSLTTNNWSLKDTNFSFLMALSDVIFVIENSALINSTISKIYKGVRYVAPLRTSTERYYRYQDLSVDEVDHQGANLAMFLTAIPKKYRESLNLWTTSNFNILISERYEGSNVAIDLFYGSESTSDNITDMGFGFSQILPIIVNLWSVSSGYENSKKRPSEKLSSIIFTIEQPELHLHPKMQADLTIVFQKAIELARSNSISLKLIIETHSQSLLSKLGDLISTEELSVNDVNVLLFNQDRINRKSSITYSTFDADGILSEWPTDFFHY
jgi:hypothetical protein